MESNERRTMANLYTLQPTFAESDEGSWSEDFVLEYGPDFEREAIAECRMIGADGAQVFCGAYGPVYGEEGYEDNYCGWLDAREGVNLQH